MLCSLTLYKALKKKYPDSRITLVAAKTNYEIPFFEINPYLDRVIVFDKSSIKTIFNFIKELRNRKYQIGIVPSTIVLSRTSHIINRISGAKFRVGVKSIDGKENESHKHLNVKADFDWKEKHQAIRNLEVVNQLSCDLTMAEIKNIDIHINEEDNKKAKAFIEKHFIDKSKKIVAVHPGAGQIQNIWSVENFFSLLLRLCEKYRIYILITCGPTDKEIVKTLTEKLLKKNIDYVIEYLPLKQLCGVLRSTDLYITNNTGTMHIAGYSGVKMISLFGPSEPNEWAPIGENQKFIKSASEDINSISVDEVFALAETFLFDKKN